MKILFLDIDGVLNHLKTQNNKNGQYIPYISDLDEICMINLLKVLNEHQDLNIIIHSAWRTQFNAQSFRNLFKELEFPSISERIYDITHPDMTKQNGIQAYVEKLKLTNFVIIDDEQLFDLKDNLHERLYKTSMHTGLTGIDVTYISKMFT